MQLEQEHGPLVETAHALLRQLHRFESRLDPGEVAHHQHFEFAQRAVWLSYLLSSALTLNEVNAYPAAFSVLRSALEHHVIDTLLFLGDRYEQVFTGVSAEEWAKYQEARQAGEDWTKNIIDWMWRDGALRVVRSGPHIEGGAGTLSVYYGFLSNFDPFRGPPEDQKYLTTDFMEPDLHERWAKKQQALYGQGLRWQRLRANLRLNEFLSEKELSQLSVHYRFLSAFVHPVSEGYVLLYGHNLPAKLPQYDHFASELVLLYVLTLSVHELLALEEMATRPPQVGLTDWADVRGHVERAEALSAHLWFPGGIPDWFDRVQEANHRGLRDGHLVPVNSPERQRPEDLQDEDIGYYRNPLVRLRRMHYSSHEMTGFPYISPWHRNDAGPF